jgi:MFS superfamily sulfate permease-like transporter
LLVGLTDTKKMVPIMQWLPLYDRQKCVGDVIAGVTVGFMVIPQGVLIALSSEQFDAVLTVGVGLCTHPGLL